MVEIIDFGLEDYGEVLERQTRLFEELVGFKVGKLEGGKVPLTGKLKVESLKLKENSIGEGEVGIGEIKEGKEYILIGEHYPVITLGRRAAEMNVLLPDSVLDKRGIKKYHIGRGGDVTFHGPGQLILYPILDLEKHRLGVKEYVNILEETVIRLLDKYGIKGERIEGATGVWIGKGTEEERKICAMGIKCSRFCTMHGLALNVDMDLSGFKMINPCGFKDKGVTSIYEEIKRKRERSRQDCGKGSEDYREGEILAASIEKDRDDIDRFKDEDFPNMKKIKEDLLRIFLSLVFPFEEVFDFLK